ncbi:hypothetical protein CPARA_2gp278 (nucleomorph) [Cryptomonas paramecium]|uniref:Uncharacterized protein n=1 Tax=Cryptomonas paramaecium TaxID=2898 RepID=F2HHZ0_9CRYP|nr:hypothetical protein CPARA_2gp278 [Cryptomonas paramecium]AEA38936.1 hypothetical protein CPARA_2gp278 [Cryptomonas paramecium]|mmetsp:Transcript_52418/g.137242  ORF Transcript_52418/g.137242 Transcript_52418/m.137242 type:complete len:214 (-) Transcript_52418:3762-4403(-)
MQVFKTLRSCYNAFFLYSKKKTTVNCKFNLTEILAEATGLICGVQKFFSFKINLSQSSIFMFFNKNSILFKKDVSSLSKFLILNQTELLLKDKTPFVHLIQCKKIRKLQFFVLKKKLIFNLFLQPNDHSKFFFLKKKNLYLNIYNHKEKERVYISQCLIIKCLKHFENLTPSKLMILLKNKIDSDSRGIIIQFEKLLRKKYAYYVKNLVTMKI